MTRGKDTPGSLENPAQAPSLPPPRTHAFLSTTVQQALVSYFCQERPAEDLEPARWDRSCRHPRPWPGPALPAGVPGSRQGKQVCQSSAPLAGRCCGPRSESQSPHMLTKPAADGPFSRWRPGLGCGKPSLTRTLWGEESRLPSPPRGGTETERSVYLSSFTCL